MRMCVHVCVCVSCGGCVWWWWWGAGIHMKQNIHVQYKGGWPGQK